MLIAGFYLFYFLAAGLLVPFLPPYLTGSLKFTATQASTIMSLTYAGMIFVPPIWGMISDRTRNPARLLKIASVITAISFVPMLWAHDYRTVIVVMLFYALAIAPLTTLADIVAVFEARRLGTEYGRLRMWGSFGYFISGVLFSRYLTRTNRDADVVPFALAMIVCYAVVAAFNNPPVMEARHAPPSFHDAKRLLMRPSFGIFLTAEFIHWTALSAYYLLFTMHLTNLHGKQYMWITIFVSVATEMLLMWSFGSVRRRVPPLAILAVASFISSARWLLVSQMTDGFSVACLQALHCFTFAGCYVGSITYMEQAVPVQLLATGRALFSSLVMGLGGVVGTLLAGKLYDHGQGQCAFYWSGILELATPPLLLACWWVARNESTVNLDAGVLPSPLNDPEIASVPTEAV